MIAEEEYQALAEAFARLHEDYENLEQEKQVKELREQYRVLQKTIQTEKIQWEKQKEEGEHEIRMLREQQQILDQHISNRNRRIEQLEGQLIEYAGYSEQFEQKEKELNLKIEQRQQRIDELEQWTGHLQSLCDERQERIEQLEYYVHHPVFSLRHLLRKWKEKGKGQKS